MLYASPKQALHFSVHPPLTPDKKHLARMGNHCGLLTVRFVLVRPAVLFQRPFAKGLVSALCFFVLPMGKQTETKPATRIKYETRLEGGVPRIKDDHPV